MRTQWALFANTIPFIWAMPGSWPFSGSRTQRRQWYVS